MPLKPPEQTDDDREVSCFETLIDGRVILVGIDREAIEDHLGSETTTASERLDFVNQNIAMLGKSAAKKLRHAPDATGAMLAVEDLGST